MTWLAVYTFIKFWLPLITLFGLIVKAYLKIKSGVVNWANILLHNHMSHIQASAEKTASSISEMATYQKEAVESQRDLVREMSGVRSDLSTNGAQILAIHHHILTDLAIIKDRVE